MSARDGAFTESDLVRVCDCPRPHAEDVWSCPDCGKKLSNEPSFTYGEHLARRARGQTAAAPPSPSAHATETPVAADDAAPAEEGPPVACPSCDAELPAWETMCGSCGAVVGGAGAAAVASSSPESYAPGLEIRGYRLEERIAEGLAGESRLWTARGPDGARVVVKAYDGQDPRRREVLARLRRLDDPAVVRVLDAFVANGVDHEIQEYLPEGTLRDWMDAHPGPVAPGIVRRILAEAARSISLIHAEELIHRDIKPSNFLVRSRAPLTLALADFGLSRRGHTGPHISQAVGRVTRHYAAPEAFGRVADPKSDWWSLGIILYELLAGEHPLKDLDAGMVQAFHLYHWIEVADGVPADWKPLVEGLLTPPVEDRWGSREVTRWLDGDRDIPVLRRRPTLGDGYDFGGRKAHTPAELAGLLMSDWTRAQAHLSAGYVTRWCEAEVRNEDLALSMRLLTADDAIPDEHWRLAVARVILDPTQPLAFPEPLVSAEEGGRRREPVPAEALRDAVLHEVNDAWCREFYREAVRIGQGAIPTLLAEHGQPGLLEWWRPRAELLRRLAAAGLDTRDPRLQRWVTREPDELVTRGEELRARYVQSPDPEIQSLLDAPALDAYGAIRLLLVGGAALRTAAEVRHGNRLAEMLRAGVAFDRERAAELLHAEDARILELGRSRQREIVRAYDDDLDRIRRQGELSVTDAALLATAAPHLYLTRGQRRSRRWARTRAAIPHLLGLGLFTAALWFLQGWSVLRHRGPLLGVVAPVLLAAVAVGALLGAMGGVWRWMAADAAAWHERAARARGREPRRLGGLRPEVPVFVAAALVLVGGWVARDEVRSFQYGSDLDAAAEAVATGRAAAVIPSLELLTERYPERVEAQLELAEALLWTRRPERADNVLARAARLDPYRASLHSLMGWLYRSREWTAAAGLADQRAAYLAPETAGSAASADASLAALVATVVPVADALWLAQDSALRDAARLFDSDDDVEPTVAQVHRWDALRTARIESRAGALATVLPALPPGTHRLRTEAVAIRALRRLMVTWPLYRSATRCAMGEPECGDGEHATLRLVAATRAGRSPHEAYLRVRAGLRDRARAQGLAWPHAESLTSRYDGRLARRYLPRQAPAGGVEPTPGPSGPDARGGRGGDAGRATRAAVEGVERILGDIPTLRDAGRYTAAVAAVDRGLRTLRATGSNDDRVGEYTAILTDLRSKMLTACRAEAAVFPRRDPCPR